MDINYDELTLGQLKDINRQSAKAIASFEDRQKKEAFSKANEIAKAAGFSSLEEMIAAQPAKRAQAEAKYRLSEIPSSLGLAGAVSRAGSLRRWKRESPWTTSRSNSRLFRIGSARSAQGRALPLGSQFRHGRAVIKTAH